MATKLVNTEKIVLHDGTTVEVRPLNIKRLREFMAITKEFSEKLEDDQGLDVLVKACFVALNACTNDKYETVEEIEELVDMAIITKIFEVAAGIDIGNNDSPNLIPPKP